METPHTGREVPPRPELVIIAAVAEKNLLIGNGMELPWRLPEDLKRFKRLTLGHPLLMGRRTFYSLIHQFGKPLPGRRNVVLTSRDGLPGYPDVETYRTIDEALDALSGCERIFVGGGGTVYKQLLSSADRLELTLVEGDFTGDTYFPPFEHLIDTVFRRVRDERRAGFRFVSYERIKRTTAGEGA